jgi:hypothetical protein
LLFYFLIGFRFLVQFIFSTYPHPWIFTIIAVLSTDFVSERLLPRIVALVLYPCRFPFNFIVDSSLGLLQQII